MEEEKKEIKQDASLAPEKDDKEENLEKNKVEETENLEESDKENTPKDETPPASEDKEQEDDGDPKPEEEPEIDYKAELEKAQKQIKQAEHTIVETKKENKELKKKDEDDWLDEDDNIDSKIEEKANQIVESKLNKFTSSLLEDVVEEAVEKLSDNPDEQELIKFYYNNKLVKSGHSKKAILDDIATAKAMANRQRLDRENKELRRAVINRSNLSSDGTTSSAKKNYSEPDVKLTPAEKKTVEHINKSRATRGQKPLKARDIISGNVDFNN